MQYKQIGDLVLPCIGIGTWGGPWGNKEDPKRWPSNPDQDSCIEAVKSAISHGATHIDTAELYGNGFAEEIVGRAIKEVPRESLFITTKVRGSNLDYDSVLLAAEKSLERLQSGHIDLYLVHWPSPNVHISETMKAMDHLVEQGLVKHVGLSNFSLQQMIEAQKYFKGKISAVQVEYNLQRRDNGRHSKGVESEIIPYSQKSGIFVIAYKPFAGGILAKRGTSEVIDSLADKYQRTPSQITLNWLLSKKNVVTIPRTTNFSHLRDNFRSLDFKIEEEDLRLLDGLSIDDFQ